MAYLRLKDFRALGTLITRKRVTLLEKDREADLDFLREHSKLQQIEYINKYGPVAAFWRERDGK